MLKIQWQDCNGECIPEWDISMDVDTALDLVYYILNYNTETEFDGKHPVYQPEFKTDNGIVVNFKVDLTNF